MSVNDAPESAGPWYRVLVSRKDGDKLTMGLAEDAASILNAHGDTAVVADADQERPPADGTLMVLAEEAGESGALAAVDGVVEGRAIALAVVADDRTEATALAHRVRKKLQAQRAFVLPRQLVVPRESLGVYGLQDEMYQERLESIIELLKHDADRLLAKREGWEEPDEAEGVEWKGPQVREREAFEEDGA